MANDDGIFPEDDDLRIKKKPPIPRAGKGLVFSEEFAEQIAAFVASPLFKKLKRIYGLQAKDRAARMCLNSAQNTEWLMFYKGIAQSAHLFFADMEETRSSVIKRNTDPDETNFKK